MIMKCPSLSLLVFLVFKSTFLILMEPRQCSHDFLKIILLSTWSIFLRLKGTFCKQHIAVLIKKIQFHIIWFLIGVFSTFIFNIQAYLILLWFAFLNFADIVFLTIEGFWQPCVEQVLVYWRHFSNRLK